MAEILIIGCGVVGAAIAYELSHTKDSRITVLDRTPPAQGCTGAALGLLMGCISQKTKGRAWKMRQRSLRRYDTLIPELEAICEQTIPYNRQGILLICTSEKEWLKKQKLVKTRQSQGWKLQCWSREQVQESCPHVVMDNYLGAIYSPQDRQVHPTILTRSLVTAAKKQGVRFEFGAEVLNLYSREKSMIVETASKEWEADNVIISAGLGSPLLTQYLDAPLDLYPVLGQAITYEGDILGNPDFQPVITANDINLVPLNKGRYWVGATVEFPDEKGNVTSDRQALNDMIQGAIAFCPTLQNQTIIDQWSGLRPRPRNQPAPVISQLPGYEQVWLATGHYRNGVLLAPATAQILYNALCCDGE